MKNFELNADVEKSTLRFGGKFHNICVSFIQYMFSFIFVI